MQASNYRLGYRSDLEGLRAVAILLVVAAHAQIAGFTGGFAGVDVFFVLSGYLITGLLVQEIKQGGQLQFAAFYARRFRRLLPGLLLMLACTAVAANFLVAPPDQSEQASAAASAALWLSNFYFAFDHMDYFKPGSDTNPFLHTWSLGVEEQFYLVWPLLLVLATGAWAGVRKPGGLRRVNVVMAVIFLASLATCAAWTSTSPELAFYMMPARAWQFALGAMVFGWFGAPATTQETGSASDHVRHAPQWPGWLGLGLILAAGMRIDSTFPYPWPWALLPSLGAAAILATGASRPASGIGAVLSVRPLQAIGRVSYSWYLWHWPVLLLGGAVINTQGVAARIALAAVSYAIAAITYRYLETPIRRLGMASRFPRAFVGAALAMMCVAGIGGTQWRDAAAARMLQPKQKRYASLPYDSPIIYAMDCDDWYHSADVHPCTFGPANAAHTAVLIGDSVAMQWFPAVVRIFREPDWRLVAFTKSACPMVDAPLFYPRIRRIYTECAQWRSEALKQVASLKPDVVLMGSTYAYELSADQWIGGTQSVLKSISAQTGHIYIIRATPRIPFNPRNCLASQSLLHDLTVNGHCSAAANNPVGEDVYGWIAKAASAYPNVALIDLTEQICPHAVCEAEREGMIIFRDREHLTTQFAESLSDALADSLHLPEVQPTSAPPGARTSPQAPMPQSTP